MLGVIIVLLGYVLGAVPTGILVGRAAGVDIRKVGSGNIGTANVLRAAGKWAAGITMFGDMLKGLLPVVLARLVTDNAWVIALTALAALQPFAEGQEELARRFAAMEGAADPTADFDADMIEQGRELAEGAPGGVGLGDQVTDHVMRVAEGHAAGGEPVGQLGGEGSSGDIGNWNLDQS